MYHGYRGCTSCPTRMCALYVCMVIYMYIYMYMVLRKFSAVHAARKAPRENQPTQLYTEQSKAQKPAFTGLRLCLWHSSSELFLLITLCYSTNSACIYLYLSHVPRCDHMCCVCAVCLQVRVYCHEGEGEGSEHLDSMDLHDVKSELERDAEKAEVRREGEEKREREREREGGRGKG